MKIPTELIPRCPVCGAPMTMNLRSDNMFVQDEGRYAAAGRYDDFVRRHKDLHVLYLELGVGANTPGIIKYPFWQMTAKNSKATYACINYGEAMAQDGCHFPHSQHIPFGRDTERKRKGSYSAGDYRPG